MVQACPQVEEPDFEAQSLSKNSDLCPHLAHAQLRQTISLLIICCYSYFLRSFLRQHTQYS